MRVIMPVGDTPIIPYLAVKVESYFAAKVVVVCLSSDLPPRLIENRNRVHTILALSVPIETSRLYEVYLIPLLAVPKLNLPLY